ncbi:hypothetical protein [Spirilliplanes yamanashiensis]|uniref:Uncharacterized protein n=1 Tax=Spirilliplanes yamanashiensis TaxID=42233 RepID=A0A8J3Y3W5_9ACTN|nr:hypothetical protein [Spirilliplanes yamanashiensis]MDP9819963.1 hypothetical protein [Spirilliplanes yamanashiensis]GIJ01218.1 hypothetical protein Sya03_05700 [Spirilliplanes yamanashiensis]
MTTQIPASRFTDHTVTGTPAQLANLLANHTAAGTLVAATAPRPTAAGTCRIILRLRDTASARSVGVTCRNRRIRRIVALGATAAGVATGVLAAVAYLLGQLIEFITAHAATIGGVALVLAVIAALAADTRNRRHCPGC